MCLFNLLNINNDPTTFLTIICCRTINNNRKISENSNLFHFGSNVFLKKRNGIFRSFDYWNFVRSHSVLRTLTTFTFNFCHNKNWIMVLSYGAASHFKRWTFFDLFGLFRLNDFARKLNFTYFALYFLGSIVHI